MGLIAVSERELRRTEVLASDFAGRLTMPAEAGLMGVTKRQAHRLARQFADQGVAGIVTVHEDGSPIVGWGRKSLVNRHFVAKAANLTASAGGSLKPYDLFSLRKPETFQCGCDNGASVMDNVSKEEGGLERVVSTSTCRESLFENSDLGPSERAYEPERG
jgi:hypothetical protein